jgi:hypothetical protein
MFQILYGSTAAGLYDQAAKLNAQARTLYLQSSDTYYKANDGAPLFALRRHSSVVGILRLLCAARPFSPSFPGTYIRTLCDRAASVEPCVSLSRGGRPFGRVPAYVPASADWFAVSRKDVEHIVRLQLRRTTTGFVPVPTGTTSTTARRLLLAMAVL